MGRKLIEPSLEQILRFCAEAPIERVFLEDVARRRQGRFAALADGNGDVTALCHLGSNLVPSGAGCDAFASLAAKSGARMLIGEAGAVSELWGAARKKLIGKRRADKRRSSRHKNRLSRPKSVCCRHARIDSLIF